MLDQILEFYSIEVVKDLGGGEILCFCPFHEDLSHPNLQVNIITDEFHCWACNAGGRSAITFIMLKENFSEPQQARTFLEKHVLASKYDVERLKRQLTLVDRRLMSLSPSSDMKAFRKQLFLRVSAQLAGFYKKLTLLDYYFMLLRYCDESNFFDFARPEFENKLQYIDYAIDTMIEELFHQNTVEELLEAYQEFQKKLEILEKNSCVLSI